MWALEGKRGQYKKYGNHWHQKRLAKGFDDIDGLGFCANPLGSNAPAYDWTAKADFSWTVTTNVTLLIPKENCDFNGPEYHETIEALSNLEPWDYGWALIGDRNKGVAPYTSGDWSDGCLSKQDNDRLDLWYASSYPEPEKRLTHLRDIFHHNFVTNRHLDFPVFGGTLATFIQNDKNSTLTPISDTLSLWAVNRTYLKKIRNKLQPSGLLISRPSTGSTSLFRRVLNNLS